jgi:hypothetical protein
MVVGSWLTNTSTGAGPAIAGATARGVASSTGAAIGSSPCFGHTASAGIRNAKCSCTAAADGSLD